MTRANRVLSLSVIALAMLAFLGRTALADSIGYTVGGWTQQFPGPHAPPAGAPHDSYPGDTVTFLGAAGTIDTSLATQVVQINTLAWSIDWTYNGTNGTLADDSPAGGDWPDLSFTFSAPRSMTIGAGPAGSVGQDGTLRATWDNDYLSLAQGSTATFYVPGYQIDVTPLGLAEAEGSNFSGGTPWAQPTRAVMARVDISAIVVPLPQAVWAAMPLLGCLASVKVFRRRRS